MDETNATAEAPATLPIEIPLTKPVRDGSRGMISFVTLTRRRNGADVFAEAAGESSDHTKLIEVARGTGVLPSTAEAMSTRDIDAIFSRWEALSGPSPRVEVWPYTLAYPIPGLSVVKEPREATGKDSRIVGRVAGDHDVLRAVVWAQVLCDLTDAQINTMDASDVEAIAKGTIPFYTGRRPLNVSQSTLPTSLSSVPGSPPNSTDC